MLGAVILLGSGALLAVSTVLGLSSGALGAAAIICVYAILLLSDVLRFNPEQDRQLPAVLDLITSPMRA
ncbi:MAG: hypothetical protein EBZ48_13080, partial [Proteobacteria bacterium]|nr:hypothetical protein [Pseudomonadota bacterium]